MSAYKLRSMNVQNCSFLEKQDQLELKRPKRRIVFTTTQANLLHSKESFVFVCLEDVLSISNGSNLAFHPVHRFI